MATRGTVSYTEEASMAQDFSGLQADLRAMEERLMDAIAKSEAKLEAKLESELGPIRESVKFLADNLLAASEKASLKLAAGGR
jgi:hypothetical protein